MNCTGNIRYLGDAWEIPSIVCSFSGSFTPTLTKVLHRCHENRRDGCAMSGFMQKCFFYLTYIHRNWCRRASRLVRLFSLIGTRIRPNPDCDRSPPKIKSIRIVDNPFDDIVPRITAAEKRAQQRARENAQREREEEARRRGAKK
jgi:hypothetical protein